MAKEKRPVPGLRRLDELVVFMKSELRDAESKAYESGTMPEQERQTSRVEAFQDTLALFEALTPKSRG